jgi:hypothetical protein
LSLTDIRSWHRHYKPDLVQSGEHIRRYGLSKWADLVPILLVLELVGCLTYLGTLIIETWVSAIIVAQKGTTYHVFVQHPALIPRAVDLLEGYFHRILRYS